MILTEPVHIHFHVPAKDHLGREHVSGNLRFLPDHVDLSWRMKGNVFTGGDGKISVIPIPYGMIEHVELVKRWFRVSRIVFRVSDPRLLEEIPSADMGKMEMWIDNRSRQEIKKLGSIIDFKRSAFILGESQNRLQAMRDGIEGETEIP